MEETSFLPRAEVERFLKFARSDIQDIVFELRDLVWQACPNATERILWGGLSYHLSDKGGPVKGAVCQIEMGMDFVRLSFIHGAWLSDPNSLLVGSRLSKRYLAIESFDGAPWPAIFDLIKEAANLELTSIGPIPKPSSRKSQHEE